MAAAAFTARELYTAHVNPTFGRFLQASGRDTVFVRASGSALFDEDGARWDDFVAGFGSLALGHNPPALKEALKAHLDEDAPTLLVGGVNPLAGELAARLVAAAPGMETCSFTNSGTEAVEAALKTALLATGHGTVLYASGGYHGTTLGALSCMARGAWRDGLESVLAPFVEVPFGDLEALESALARADAAAFLVEPVQMEAGARVAPPDYLRGAAEACRRHGALLVLDEVQTGMGRTGRLFACEHAGVAPDILVLAKALGGGLVPIGATLMGEGLWRRAWGGLTRCELLASTFGGNALSCRVALEALGTLSSPSFLAAVAGRAEELFGALRRALAPYRCVESISWLGLLGGVRFRDAGHPWARWESLGLPELAGRPVAGALVVERLYRKRILAQLCGHDWSVVRVEPPLTVDRETCARFVAAMAEAAAWLDENG